MKSIYNLGYLLGLSFIFYGLYLIYKENFFNGGLQCLLSGTSVIISFYALKLENKINKDLKNIISDFNLKEKK